MSIWSRLIESIQKIAAKAGSLADLLGAPTPPEKSVAFAIAVVALGAKIAKADGQVTRDEVDAFKEVFFIPPGEEKNAARVFNLAREDSAGFEGYATRIRAMFRDDDDRATLEDILDGLFHIAGADGVYDPRELEFLARVAEIFEIEQRCFDRLLARHDPSISDPYQLLGVLADAPLEEVKAAWRALVRETHPDRMMARGVPEEAVKLATERLQALNAAYERIKTDRAGAHG
ncbi:MAG: molecular chaperone DjiA [Neomegalonema sp.]|nr:molecular chaperone DjiA [Neomegalonema sp.]